MTEVRRRRGTWRYDEHADSYYFKLSSVPAGRMVQEVIGMVEVASDGTFAGVVLFGGAGAEPPPPPAVGVVEPDNAYWTCDDQTLVYYIAPTKRGATPFTTRQVLARCDLADDGTLVGVKLVSSKLPPPPR